MGSVGANKNTENSANVQSQTSTFKFRELPEGNSNADKRIRATRIVQDYYAISERGTFRDLLELNNRVGQLDSDKKLLKGDEKRLTNARATAERGVRARKAY